MSFRYGTTPGTLYSPGQEDRSRNSLPRELCGTPPRLRRGIRVELHIDGWADGYKHPPQDCILEVTARSFTL